MEYCAELDLGALRVSDLLGRLRVRSLLLRLGDLLCDPGRHWLQRELCTMFIEQLLLFDANRTSFATGGSVDDLRRNPEVDSVRRVRAQARAATGLVAGYIHELSERHGRARRTRPEREGPERSRLDGVQPSED